MTLPVGWRPSRTAFTTRPDISRATWNRSIGAPSGRLLTDILTNMSSPDVLAFTRAGATTASK